MSNEYHKGYYAQKSGADIYDNPYGKYECDHGLEREYVAWRLGFLESKAGK